ncbi:MAG: DNA mismatch repair protein MutL [Gemmatimonadales bacterium]|nr:MAG: DNA mismatch repair protein MutL [Gemmatimonadales bacterium]
MGRIVVLPDSVVDQIAAGEVVERPASVVKELVENSLDAGASEIVIELEAGGSSLVRVSDDGCGMDRDDAVLAINRHATSKIRSSRDLVGVATYGFRGEALAAIAAVSTLELETAVEEDGGVGTRVRAVAGKIESVDRIARRRGTAVSVRRLFFNVPARRKFLRSLRSETRAAVEAVVLLALARLDVSFRLVSEGRVLLDAPRTSQIAERLAALFGRRFAEELLPVDYASGAISVRGFVQRPADARPAGRRAYLFVNGRPFKDPLLVRAAEAGYRAAINPGCRPSILLAISLPGESVDVNVHPAKLEVRFRDRFLVERAVEEAVARALRPLEAAAAFGSGSAEFRGESIAAVAPGLSGGEASPVTEGSLFGEAESRPPLAPGGVGNPIQVFATYIVFETPDGLAIVDQHSAHERVLYEAAMAQLKSGGAAAQHLLLPLTIELEPSELAAFEEHRDLFRSVGFEAEAFGGNTVVLHAVPNPHPRFDARRCFEELVADLTRGRFGAWKNRLERFAATYACRAAIKAGQLLEPVEIRELLSRLFACELPPHDVHGRPAIVQLPRAELERRFGRS